MGVQVSWSPSEQYYFKDNPFPCFQNFETFIVYLYGKLLLRVQAQNQSLLITPFRNAV